MIGDVLKDGEIPRIVAEAEEALDRAKQIGGNRVEMAGGSN